MSGEADNLYKKGREAFKNGKTLEALALFEKAYTIKPEDPKHKSFLGLCIASERGKIKEAIKLCEDALFEESHNIDYYLNLGLVYYKAGLKLMAIEVFRKGLEIDKKNPEIIAELQALGLRKNPPLSFLHRNHFLNKYIGIIFSKLGLS